MSAVKIARARRLSETGRYPETFRGLVSQIPATLAATLTSRQLAAMVDVMADVARESKALAARENIDEGAIWDARSGQMRNIVAHA